MNMRYLHKMIGGGGGKSLVSFVAHDLNKFRGALAAVLSASYAFSLIAETPDKFIQYAEATGKQAVDTGIVGRYDTRAEMKMEWMLIGSDTAFLDARGQDGTTGNNTRVMFCHQASSGQISMGYGDFIYGTYNKFGAYWEADRQYTVKTDFSRTNNNTQVWRRSWVDGVQVKNDIWDGTVDTGNNLYVFANNYNGTTQNQSKSRCYWLKIWQDGSLVRDFRPCMKDGRVGLYDSVSENIFYSNTGTDLVYDTSEDVPDEYIEYVDSNSDTYVDTDVIGRSGTKMETQIEWLALGDDYALLDARKTTGGEDRFFLAHSAFSKMSLGYGGFIGNDGKLYETGTRYVITSDLKVGSQVLTVNGETKYSGSSSTEINTGRNLYLFANNRAGSVENNSKVRLYYMKIWQDDKLVRDFKPCRKHGIPALYDEVEGRIFYGQQARLRSSNDYTVASKPDYFVEYIQANGNNHIDTGVCGRYGTRAAGEFEWTQMRDSNFEMYTYLESPVKRQERSYLAAVGSDNSRFYMVHENNETVWWGYGDTRGYPEVVTTNTVEEAEVVSTNRITLAANRKYSFDVSYSAGSQTVDIDGVRLASADSDASVDSGCNLYLFACNSQGNPLYGSPTRCYWLKLWQDGTLVRDFRPCVKDGRGMLWDDVSKTLYRPIPDIMATGDNVGRIVGVVDEEPESYIEYVESDGNQYIDTEVIGRSGTVAEFKMQWKNLLNDEPFLAARGNTNTDSRCFFWGKNKKYPYYGYGKTYYIDKNDPTLDDLNNTHDNRLEITTNTDYTVRSSFDGGNLSIVCNGKTIVNRSNVTTAPEVVTNLYLFAANWQGSPSYYNHARLYWLRIWQDGQLVRNLRPVTMKSGVAILWDSVSKRFFVPNKFFSAKGPVTRPFNCGLMFIVR